MIGIRRLLAMLAAGLLAASAVSAPLASAQTTPSAGGFSVRPAEFNPAIPSTRAYFQRMVRTGKTFTGKVVLANSEATPLELRVYPVDGLTAVTSGAVYGNRGARLVGAGRWLAPSTSLVTLPPESRRLVAFTVTVPRTATAGDHLAGIAVEPVHPARSVGRISITEVVRVVVGIEIRVPGPAAPALSISHAAITALPGTGVAAIVIGIANRGGLACRPKLAVRLQGAGPAQAVTRTLDTVLPGSAIAYPLGWTRALEPGSYDVSIGGTRCGRRVSFAAVVHAGTVLSGTSQVSPAQRPRVEATTAGWLMAAVAGGAGLLLGSLIAVALLARRRGAEARPRTRPRVAESPH